MLLDNNTNQNYIFFGKYNQFKDWLENIQKDHEINDEIIQQIKEKLDNKKITKESIKEILKKLKYNKYYEYSNDIYNILLGKEKLKLDKDTEDYILKNMKIICEIKYKYLDNKAISFNFMARKLLEEIKKEEYYDDFPYLNSKDKLNSQNTIWEEINSRRYAAFASSL